MNWQKRNKQTLRYSALDLSQEAKKQFTEMLRQVRKAKNNRRGIYPWKIAEIPIRTGNLCTSCLGPPSLLSCALLPCPLPHSLSLFSMEVLSGPGRLWGLATIRSGSKKAHSVWRRIPTFGNVGESNVLGCSG